MQHAKIPDCLKAIESSARALVIEKILRKAQELKQITNLHPNLHQNFETSSADDMKKFLYLQENQYLWKIKNDLYKKINFITTGIEKSAK